MALECVDPRGLARYMNSRDDKLLPIRFSPEADTLLRPPNSRRGDIARRILEAIAAVDLLRVPVEERPKTPYQKKEYVTTTVKFPIEVHRKLTKAAAARNPPVSISALIDGCVKAHWTDNREE